jgi:hypothetical protein
MKFGCNIVYLFNRELLATEMLVVSLFLKLILFSKSLCRSRFVVRHIYHSSVSVLALGIVST